MIKNFDKRLDEITDQHADIQKELSDINLSQEKRKSAVTCVKIRR